MQSLLNMAFWAWLRCAIGVAAIFFQICAAASALALSSLSSPVAQADDRPTNSHGETEMKGRQKLESWKPGKVF